MLTNTTKPTRFVFYPHSPPAGAWTTIRNNPESIAQYIRQAAPHLCHLCVRARKHWLGYEPDLAREACMLVINQRVTIHPEPREIVTRRPFYPREQHQEIGIVDGWSIRQSSVHGVYCECDDVAAPSSPVATYTCEHILAFSLAEKRAQEVQS